TGPAPRTVAGRPVKARLHLEKDVCHRSQRFARLAALRTRAAKRRLAKFDSIAVGWRFPGAKHRHHLLADLVAGAVPVVEMGQQFIVVGVDVPNVSHGGQAKSMGIECLGRGRPADPATVAAASVPGYLQGLFCRTTGVELAEGACEVF